MRASNRLKKFIVSESERLGFDKVGFTKAEKVDAETENAFRLWLEKGYHGSMKWMENHTEKRLDPSLLVEGGKTVVCFATNYYQPVPYKKNKPYISKYALGDDYHDVLKKRLKQLYQNIQSEFPDVEGRYFTDTAPILERYWAEKSGIGWQGKNTLLLTREFGSYVFLSVMIINQELEPDRAHENFCGTCTACLDGCPTNAFVEAKVLNSTQCISYLTIEYRDAFTDEQSKQIGNNIYGCDICQEVCPWNKFVKECSVDEFKPRSENTNRSMSEWETLTEDTFRTKFTKSAVKRTKFAGLFRNISSVKKNLGDK